MKFLSKLLIKQAGVKIRLMRRDEFEHVLDIAYRAFQSTISQSEEEFKQEVREELANRFSCCYVAEVDGQIVGGYLLSRRHTFEELQKIDKEIKEKGFDLTGKKGVQGVALFVLPEFRNANIGRELRDIPATRLNVDFVWGQHYKSLNNLSNWLNAGRVLLGEGEDYVITLKELPRSPKPSTPSKKKVLKEDESGYNEEQGV